MKLSYLLFSLSISLFLFQCREKDEMPLNTQIITNTEPTGTPVVQKEIQLRLQNDADMEADEKSRMPLSNFQPTGVYVKKGEIINIYANDIGPGNVLKAYIGFRTLWDDANKNDIQIETLQAGNNKITTKVSGVLYLIYSNNQSSLKTLSTLTVTINGGYENPLFILGKTDINTWNKEILANNTVKFVDLVSDKVLITIPATEYKINPVLDASATFNMIHKVLKIEDDLAGFDNSAPIHSMGNNRYHFVVDYLVSPSKSPFYMYATSYFIGLLKDNFTDLIDPNNLNKRWGIWHEIGHTHQQNAWSWGDVIEVNVNVYSLKVQEEMGLKSRLYDIEIDPKQNPLNKNSYQLAKTYLASTNKIFVNQSDSFMKLVMYDQLRKAFGWEFYTKLHKITREKYIKPEYASQINNITDAQKLNNFILLSSQASQTNLVKFFQYWGLKPSTATIADIEKNNWPEVNITIANYFGA